MEKLVKHLFNIQNHQARSGKRVNESISISCYYLYCIATLKGIGNIREFEIGEVAEWSNVPDSKSGVPQGTAGSNPALSAMVQADYFE